MKQLKDIFGRKTSIWLALELVLVTFACWWAFDPVIVNTYVTHLPLGYDIDRLVLFEIGSNTARQINMPWEEELKLWGEEESLLRKVQEIDGVEMACHVSQPLFGGITGMFHPYYHERDSLHVLRYPFKPNSNLFEVYGIRSITPSVPTEELTRDAGWDDVIVTRSFATDLYGTIDVAGRRLQTKELDWSSEVENLVWVDKYYNIRAVVEDVRYAPYDRESTLVFQATGGISECVPIIARLREGVNPERFVSEHEAEVQRTLVTDHRYVHKMTTGREEANFQVNQLNMGRQMRRNLLIAAFFAINLAFGVFGTLLMYTRQRREEAGVRRAFGATKWSVFWGFIREAWLLTTLSVIVGCIVYFQFAASRGLYDDYVSSNPAVRYWFDDFGTHFLVVSVIVYIIILCTVLIGTAIPAWRICRSEITVALKDE